MGCSEAGGSILCQRGTSIPPCAPGEDCDAEGAGDPGWVALGTVGLGSGTRSEGFLQACAWKENLGPSWEPPAPAGLAEQAWKMVNDHLDQLQAFSWLVCHNS